MKFRPLNGAILLRRHKRPMMTEGGLHIPENARSPGTYEAEVVAVGPGVLKKGKRKPPQVKPGDKVLISQFSGFWVFIEGEKLMMLLEDDILGFVE